MSVNVIFPVHVPLRSRPAMAIAKVCFAYHIKKGHYNEGIIGGSESSCAGQFVGNIWGGETKATMGIFIDETSQCKKQREALQMIWAGRSGGFPAGLC